MRIDLRLDRVALFPELIETLPERIQQARDVYHDLIHVTHDPNHRMSNLS